MKNKFPFIKKLSANPKVPFLIIGASVVAVIIVAFLWAKEGSYGVLFGNINDKDGGEIVSQLEQMNIPYKFSSSGAAILIPEEKVHETRLRLAQQGLPKNGVVGFELLDKERFGVSQFSEQINYQRALEGELSRTIATLDNIENARVHLALPKPSLFVRERKQPSASVTLALRPGRALSQEQINAITHLISSSVAELSANKVTIVDQSGELLTSNKMRGIHLDTTQLEFTEKIENRIRRHIEKILTPLLGPENIRVQVAADIDFSRQESTAEIYDPNHEPASQAIRSQQRSKQSQVGMGSGIGGVPGALSNQPIPVASAPIQQQKSTKNDKKEEGRGENRSPHSLQFSDIINYEVSRKAIHSRTPEGNIKRLSVAVLVNYKLTEDKKTSEGSGKEKTVLEFKPLASDVLANIESLTKQAMGFSSERGDSITVANLEFSHNISSTVDTPIWKQPAFYNVIWTMGCYLIFMLLAWLAWAKVLKPQWRKIQQNSNEREHNNPVVPPGDDELVENSEMRHKRIFENSMQQQHYVREMVAKDPKVTANILRNWINRDNQ